MEYIVKYQQSLLDIALQEYGSVEGLVPLCVDNNLSITADLEIGQIIKVDTTKIIDQKVVEYYKNNNIIIATDIPRPNRRQTITFASLGNLEIGDVVTLNAVASSGLVVLYFSSNPSVAVVENNTLTVVGTGDVTITASQVGDNIFYPISTSQTVTIINIALDETNLVFDFDFEATAKQTLRDSIYLTNYIDRGLNFAQGTASKQPTVTSEGILFDGVDDFLTVVAPASYPEVWVVLKSTVGGNFSGIRCAFAASSGVLADPRFGVFSTDNTPNIGGQVDENRVNNVVTNDFSPIDEFKVLSASRATYYRDNFAIGAYSGGYGGIFFWNGTIKRILVFDTILSEERRTALQEYLAYTYTL